MENRDYRQKDGESNADLLTNLVRAIQRNYRQSVLILVRCDNISLRDKVVTRLQELYASESTLPLRKLVLPQSCTTLFTTIQLNLVGEQPQALMVFGLESVEAIDKVLIATNNVREEFRNSFPFPIVLWITTEVQKKLIRSAHDFFSWIALSYEFIITKEENEDLVDFLKQSVKEILFTGLDIDALRRAEIELAFKELQNRNISLEVELTSKLQSFIIKDNKSCIRDKSKLETEQNQIEQIDLITENERSLRRLTRVIGLSQGSFSLVLVACNYSNLRERIVKSLENLCPLKIHKITLPTSAKNLYTPIHSRLGDDKPDMLMVFGLEYVEELDTLLKTTNQMREKIIAGSPFPIVIYVNGEIVQQLIRLAPDFYTWTTIMEFVLTPVEVQQLLKDRINSFFAKTLDIESLREDNTRFQYPHNMLEHFWKYRNYEFHCAIKDLQNANVSLEPELDASLKFIFGLNDYVNDRTILALSHFQQGLQIWQHLVQQNYPENQNYPVQNIYSTELDIVSNYTSSLLRQGILLYYIGLCCCRLAEQNQVENRRYWYTAKSNFQQCLSVLQLAQRPSIIAEFIGQLAEVLQHLQEWEELQSVARTSLELHQIYGSQIQLACDYGFLAQVAVQQSRWPQASVLAHVSLLKLTEAQKHADSHQYLFPLLLGQIYYLVLAKAHRNLGEQEVAYEYLEKASKELPEALESSAHQYDAHRYIRLLRTLRSLYFAEGRYLEAYYIRQKRRSVEQQYGFRAFIGVGRLQPQRYATNPALMSPTGSSSVALEIAASGRERDINNLIGRISRADQKLTVIHGQSGVGKSSTVTAGLVPALQNRAVGDQIAVPVVLQVYPDWIRELGKALSEAITQIKGDAYIESDALLTPITTTSILQQLQENADNDLITVLIFDQFEEFFFGYSDRQQKQEFDKFISDCLKISFVKVILSLREDYLHRLLEFKHLSAVEAINNNILDKNIRYQLNNFSPEYAKAMIRKLTERSQFYLESPLIDALVEDLLTEFGEVRPIELQVVGAQLQDERITTLEQYQQYRPNKLIERYIKELIKDCGPENERAALLVLYLLTDESSQRPFKTRAELATELAELEDAAKLELVLDILVCSGLVVLFPDVPERYQLIHDYLADLIRYLQQQESSLQVQLNQLRYKVEQSQGEIERLKSELTQKRQQVKLIDIRQQGLDLVAELRELRKREELSQLEIEQLRAELKEKELTAQLSESQKQRRLIEVRLNRVLKIALVGAIAVILILSTLLIKGVNINGTQNSDKKIEFKK